MGDRRINIYRETVVTGLNQYGGYVQEELLPELSGDRWKRTIRAMLSNDGVIAAFLFAIEMMVRQIMWRMDPADDSNEARQGADFAWGALNDMSQSWADTVSEVVSFIPWCFYIRCWL